MVRYKNLRRSHFRTTTPQVTKYCMARRASPTTLTNVHLVATRNTRDDYWWQYELERRPSSYKTSEEAPVAQPTMFDHATIDSISGGNFIVNSQNGMTGTS